MIQVLDENSNNDVRVESEEDGNPRYFEAYISALPDCFHMILHFHIPDR